MSRRQIPSLTQGAIPSIIQSPVYAETPNLQVLGWKNLQGESSRPGERSGNDRYRILLSDGKYSYAYGMLATQLNHLITDGQLEAFTIIKVKKVICNKITSKTNTGKDPKKIIIILELDILVPGSEVGEKLGNPHPLNEGDQVEEPVHKASNGSSKPQPVFSPKKPQPQSRTEQSVVTHPIVSLTPYQNKWTVKVRVTNKGEIRTWSNSRGDGKLFSMDLMDDSGEIRATAFNAECDKFYHMIETNKVYYISGANLKAANKQYTSIKNDYEMSFNSNTQVTPCYEDASDIPQVTFNFVPISELSKLDKDSMIDVIGIAKSATDVATIVSRTTNKELKKREVHLVDSTNTEVNLTLWGKTAEDFDVSSQPVIAMKGVKLSDFGGRSLGVVSQTVFQVNPDMPEAHKLRGWYDNIGCTSQMTSISVGKGSGVGGGGSSAWKTFADVKLENLGNGEKPDYYTAKAMVAMINKERALYMACPSPECNKKVVDQNNGLYRCEKCQREFQDYKWRVMLSVNITDFTDHQWVTCFQEAAETLLGRSADELGRLKDSDPAQFQKVFEDSTFKWFVFRLRVKMEMYNDENRLKTTVFEVKDLNYKDYNERMIREIKELNLSH